jgi:hypothetical protein
LAEQGVDAAAEAVVSVQFIAKTNDMPRTHSLRPDGNTFARVE